MPLDNSQIRRIILKEHEDLRLRLDEIEAGLEQLAAGQAQPLGKVRSLFQSLLEAFVRHLEREETLLKPILKDLDAWGPVRLVTMELEHREQREHVARLLSLEPDAAISEWVSEMRSFASRLREDMAGEEHDLLNPDVLRDDTISIDPISG